MTVVDNRDEGALFEKLCIEQARANGLFVEKNPLAARYVWGGRVQTAKSNLDLTLITQAGLVGFVDCKSFDADRFSYSQLTRHQIDRATFYNEWNLISGFIIHFRPSGEIGFFSGERIQKGGPRSSFGVDDSIRLGNWARFDLKILFKAKKKNAS